MAKPRFPQLLLDTHEELIVDLFAGGGGASLGIEMATGRMVDIAINHDATAVAMHRVNHPQTTHHVCDVFEADPRTVTEGRPVGLLWASPDCTDHSKAKGGKPFRDTARKRRALAWVVTRWAGQVRPRVICLENVEEFAEWGPLIGLRGELRRCPRRKGRTFRAWVRSLERLGYVVEWRELRACDFGAPTIRKRLFVVARCDGRPIVWPKPTHGPRTRRKYRTAAECIDWSIPMLSIFATREEAIAWGRAHGQAPPKRPLAEATMRRIARGVVRFVLEAPEPFVVTLNHGGTHAPRGVGEPLRTLTSSRDAHGLVAPYLVPRYGEREGQEPRTRSVAAPAPVIVPTGNGASLAAAFLARHWGGMVGKELDVPFPTVLTKGAQDQLAAVHLSHAYTSNTNGGDGNLERPAKTIVTGGHHGLVASFLQRYHGQGVGSALGAPASTLTTKDRLGLVTVMLKGEPYVVVDIAMRMLQPRELFRAQGFPDSYAIERGADGRRLTKTAQVRLVGNSVCPDVAAALVRANCAELIARDEARRSA